MTFSGLKSRWTSPAACAAAQAAAGRREDVEDLAPACAALAAARRRACALDELHRDEDAIADVPASCTTTTLGCDSRAIAFASRSSRARRSAASARRVARSSLSATSPIELGIVRGVDLAHAAPPDQGQHRVASDWGSTGKRRLLRLERGTRLRRSRDVPARDCRGVRRRREGERHQGAAPGAAADMRLERHDSVGRQPRFCERGDNLFVEAAHVRRDGARCKVLNSQSGRGRFSPARISVPAGPAPVGRPAT